MAGLAAAASSPLAAQQQSFLAPAGPVDVAKTDFNLQIGPVTVELAPNRILSTIGYNGTSPGPLLRMKEGVPVTVNVVNKTDVPEYVHFHGLLIPSDVDGSEEEGTPEVPPHGSRTYKFTPTPAGTRWYHTHTMSMDDLHRGSYTGMFGFLIVEGASLGQLRSGTLPGIARLGALFHQPVDGQRRSGSLAETTRKARRAGYAAGGHGSSGRYFFDQRQGSRRGRADPRECGPARDVSFSERQRDREPASGSARSQIQRRSPWMAIPCRRPRRWTC